MLRVSPDIVNSELSASPAPATSEYVGFCPSRYVFCAAMSPTASVPLLMKWLSSTIYQGPKFWLKEVASANMLDM